MKKLRILSMFMVVLLIFSLTTVLGTSAATTMAGNVAFTAQASFNKITVNPPEKAGNYYFEIFEADLGYEVVASLSQSASGDWVFEDFDSSLLFTESTEEYFAYTADGSYEVIYPEREYYIIVYALDIEGDVTPVINYGVKRVATTATPDAYKGYEGYMKNTVDFEVIPGTNSLTFEPVNDGRTYVASAIECPDGMTVELFEEAMGTIPAGAYGFETGEPLDAESVAMQVVDMDGNSVEVKPNTDYLVVYYMVDSDTFPALAVTYGAKIVKTVESLDVYDSSDRYVVVMDGDANRDSEVTIKDATLIQKHIAKTQTITDERALNCADTTGDREINIKDATAIQKWLAKMDTNTAIGTVIPVMK